MTLDSFISLLGEEVDDIYEESFILFSAVPSSRNLGFIDRSASSLSLTVAGQDLTIHQSPALLSSSREAGTTGAVLWKITPAFADWVCSKDNLLFTHGILSSSSSVLELGSGSSALLGLTIGMRVGNFILSDQEYVLRLIRKNLDENLPATKASIPPKRRRGVIKNSHTPDILAISLDWETDSVRHHPALSACSPFSAVIACDTIYNEALVKPFVDTCADACSLARQNTDPSDTTPAITIIAQELRSFDVFEHWLEIFQKSFHTYRIPDLLLPPSLRSTSGYSIHIGILRAEVTTSRN